MLHLSCDTLSYAVFLRVLLTKDYTLLKKEDYNGEEQPTTRQYVDAWLDIEREYVSAIRTHKTQSIHELWKRIVFTQCRLNLVEQSLYALSVKYDVDIVECLLNLGYGFIDDPGQGNETDKAYLRSLDMVAIEAKTLIVQLGQLQNEYNILCPPGKEIGSERTMADYDKEIAAVSKFMGFVIRKNEITVTEWAGFVNLFLEVNIKE